MKKYIKSYAGFTIIELIVVIAIIAVLAAIVLVNVTQYINKGKDAAIEGNMATLLTDGSTYFDNNKAYKDLTADPQIDFCADNFRSGKPIFDQDPSAAPDKYCNESSDGTAWAACSQMIAASGYYWCVDSTGTKEKVSVQCSAFTGTVCP